MSDIFKKTEEALKQLDEEVNKKQKDFWHKFHQLESKKIEIDDELLKEWLEEYWLLYRNPDNQNEWIDLVGYGSGIPVAELFAQDYETRSGDLK